MQNDKFRLLLQEKGQELYRDMPWRRDTQPYYVMVSEIMLQQTQVSRVIPKFEAFIERFPSIEILASSPLGDVLIHWQGLGYNRRAKYLHDAAKKIVNEYNGEFPSDQLELVRLPGIGKNTAGAIGAYSFNQPSIFIETNIRTVYIHHFFADDFDITDKQIQKKLEETLDREHPREWYWSLMDYGSWLKTNGVRNVGQSKHYKKQSPLEGSLRQMRGRIMRELSTQGDMTRSKVKDSVKNDARLEPALEALIQDGLVRETDGNLHLTK